MNMSYALHESEGAGGAWQGGARSSLLDPTVEHYV